MSQNVVDSDLDVYINFDNSGHRKCKCRRWGLYGSPMRMILTPTILWNPGGTTSNIDVTPTTNTSYTYTLTEKLSNSCPKLVVLTFM
jgi:hypothetical protein